jgi:hypothetical protein
VSLLIPFRLKRSYDKIVLEDLCRRRKFTHVVTVRFPISSRSPLSGVCGLGRRLLDLIMDGIILLIVGWIIIWTSPTKQRLRIASHTWWWSTAAEDTTKLKKGGIKPQSPREL